LVPDSTVLLNWAEELFRPGLKLRMKLPRFRGTGLFGFEESTMAKTRGAYPPELRRQMVELVRSGRSPEELAHDCRDASVRPSMGSVGDAYDTAMCESFFATLECELLDRCRFKTQFEARSAVFTFIEGFYNPRHSSIGYLSPIDYERRHHAAAVDRDAHQHAAVLAAVKDKPVGRPQEAAVLDRHRARRPSHRAGRDERMAPPGAEPKNGSIQEDMMPSDQSP
jgi:hypothetical protein